MTLSGAETSWAVSWMIVRFACAAACGAWMTPAELLAAAAAPVTAARRALKSASAPASLSQRRVYVEGLCIVVPPL